MASYTKLPSWHADEPQRPARRPYRRLLALGALFAVVLLAGLFHAPIARSMGSLTDSVCQAREFTHRYNVTEHEEFQDLSAAGDAQWDSLFTENGAYLFRETPTASGGTEIRVYGVSMFHQLHCLRMIRIALQGLNATAHGQVPPGHHNIDDRHYMHCLDYIRQAVICNADSTIEAPQRDPKDYNHDIVDGEGERRCRNSEQLYEWARLSGPSLDLRKKVLSEGKSWPGPQGVKWIDPIN